MPFDAGIELCGRRHGGRVEQAHHPRLRPELGEDVVKHELVGRSRDRREPIGIGQHEFDLLGEEVVPVLRREFAALKPAHVPDAPTHRSLGEAARSSVEEGSVVEEGRLAARLETTRDEEISA